MRRVSPPVRISRVRCLCFDRIRSSARPEANSRVSTGYGCVLGSRGTAPLYIHRRLYHFHRLSADAKWRWSPLPGAVHRSSLRARRLTRAIRAATSLRSSSTLDTRARSPGINYKNIFPVSERKINANRPRLFTLKFLPANEEKTKERIKSQHRTFNFTLRYSTHREITLLFVVRFIADKSHKQFIKI